MSKIQTLDTQLMNMIAAGEVVERPSGIVKELVENAIDAKATRINVVIKEGGIKLIDVIDNGEGMDASDATKAFERHATSKIKTTNDLWNIHTLGFRGEALPSIASVSKVKLHTSDGKDSTEIKIEYGDIVSAKPYPCNLGTEVEVTGLFEKTPARLKHLKSVPYESSLISDIIYKFSMSNPEISFRLEADGRELINTTGNNDLREIIYKIYGKDQARTAIPFEANDYDYRINGFLINPQFTKASKNAVNIFMNHRMVRPYRIQKAVIDAYHLYMDDDRYPLAIINIEMDPKIIDVNVHPSKWEVRLSKEMQLEYFIKDTITKVLKDNFGVKEIIKVKDDTKVSFESFDLSLTSVPYTKTEEIYPTVKEDNSTPIQEEVNKEVTGTSIFASLHLIGQLHGKYILCESDDALYIIDQHAAEERVNYEKILTSIENKKYDQNVLLVPLTIHTTPLVVTRIEELNNAYKEYGLNFEAFGNDTLLVRSLPSYLTNIDENIFINDLIENFVNDNSKNIAESRKDKIATMACHRSIRFNHHLSTMQMQEVINALGNCNQPFNCPHGRPTLIKITSKQLIKEFDR